MGLFDWFSGKKPQRPESAEDLPSMPWDNRPSLYQHVKQHLAVGKSGLAGGGRDLPDEEQVRGESQIRWAPGAADGVLTHHMGTGGMEDDAKRAVELIIAYCGQPTALNKAALYNQLIGKSVVSLIDHVIEAVVSRNDVNHDRLYELAHWLATQAPDREPVKLGIALLGLYREPRNLEVFQTLGRHDEFTLFAAVAIGNASDDPEELLWDLARNVEGWGRVHLVERLSDTTRPEVKKWLLREGFRNAVLVEYVACICARAGGLLAAISEDRCDRELLAGAGEIIEALLRKGPAEDIDSYEDGILVVEHYLRHMSQEANTLGDLLTVASIKSFVDQEDDELWESRTELGWTTEKRQAISRSSEEIIGRPRWLTLTRELLTSADDAVFDEANRAAKLLGIDTWDYHWARLQEQPLNPGRWYHGTNERNPERFRMVADFAERSLPLNQIATGPGNEMGLGPGWEADSSLGFVLQELGAHPGIGVVLVRAALQSRVIRSRNVALRVLHEWGKQNWSAGLSEALQRAIDVEPVDDVRARMVRVLQGQPLEVEETKGE